MVQKLAKSLLDKILKINLQKELVAEISRRLGVESPNEILRALLGHALSQSKNSVKLTAHSLSRTGASLLEACQESCLNIVRYLTVQVPTASVESQCLELRCFQITSLTMQELHIFLK